MKFGSIRFRLTAGYAAVLAVTFTAVAIGVWWAVRDSIYDTVDKDLRSRVGAVREFLRRERGDLRASVDELVEDAAVTPTGTRFRIADDSGKWLYQSPTSQGWPAPPDAGRLPARGVAQTLTQKGKTVRIVSAAVPSGVIQIGVPIDEFTEMLDGFTWTALFASPLLLILASAGGYWMSRRALAPVELIARTADDIEARNLGKRLPLSGTGDELDHLSITLNAMFGRLEDAFRRITQFTADASHELRTPVAIIRTTAEVARRKPRSAEEYEQALDRIVAESERTTGLIENLLMLARADAGADDIATEPIRLDDLVRDACAAASSLADMSGVIVRSGGFSECIVMGDRQALRRVLLILLDNAIKYSKAGAAVDVTLSSGNGGGRARAVLAVRDEGIGIGPEHLPYLFERFYRASKDRSRRIEGVGLGLSIAQSIARRHGGEIRISSEPGRGTTAELLLPLV